MENFEDISELEPVLILVPNVGMIDQWVGEINKFTYRMRVIGVRDSKVCLFFLIPNCDSYLFSKDIMNLNKKLDYKFQPRVVVSNYHKLTKSATDYWEIYQQVRWSTIVCDEAHFFHNANSL